MLKDLRIEKEDLTNIFIGAVIVGVLLLLSSIFSEQFSATLNVLALSVTDFQMILVFFAIFFVLIRLIESAIFIPFLELLEAREAATIGATSEAESNRQRATNLEREFERELTEARMEALQERAAALRAAQQEAQTVTQNAESAAAEELKAAREKLEKEAQEARSAAHGDIESLSNELVEKILTQGAGENQSHGVGV